MSTATADAKRYVSFFLISLDETTSSCENQWSCCRKNLKGLKDKVSIRILLRQSREAYTVYKLLGTETAQCGLDSQMGRDGFSQSQVFRLR